MQSTTGKMTLYCSQEAHSSVQKAVEILGFGSESLRRIPVNDAMQIDTTLLKEAIHTDRAAGFLPICIIGAAGTTKTAAIDDLNTLPKQISVKRKTAGFMLMGHSGHGQQSPPRAGTSSPGWRGLIHLLSISISG